MADRYWIAGSAANWNDTANWSTTSGGSSGASVPGSGDVAIFDANGLGDCRFNASMAGCSISVPTASTYTGNFDFDTDDLDHTVLDVNFQSGTWTWGAGKITCTGNFETSNSCAVASGGASGSVVSLSMTGTTKTMTIRKSDFIKGRLEIAGSITWHNNSSVDQSTQGSLIVVAGGTFTLNQHYRIDSGTWIVENTGTFTGTATYYPSIRNGTLTVNAGGTWSPDSTRFWGAAGTISNAMTIDGDLLQECDITFPSGTTVITGDWTWSYTDTQDNTTNNPDIEVRGDIIASAIPTAYTKGTGTITLSGTANQLIDFQGESVEDIVINKASGTVTLTGNVTTDSLVCTSGGNIDFATYNVTCNGTFDLSHLGGIDFGSGSHYFGGYFDVKTAGTMICGTSSIELAATGQVDCFLASNTNYSANKFYNVTISGSYSNTNQGYVVPRATNSLTITGSFTNNALSNRNVSIDPGGTMTISGTLAGPGIAAAAANNTANTTLNASGGTVTCAAIELAIQSTSTGYIAVTGGDFSQTTFRLETTNGSSDALFRFSDGVTIGGLNAYSSSGGDLHIDNAANNPNLTITGNVSDTAVGKLSWGKGTGTLTLSGTANQSIDFNGEAVEEIDIDKTAGTVTLAGSVTCDFFDITDGTFDINGNNMTSSGNFTQAQDTICQDTLGGGLITVGGNFAINGASGFGCTWNGPDLAVTGTAVAGYVTATNSNASGGTQVTATNSTDGGGNTNWNFGGGGATIPALLEGGMLRGGLHCMSGGL